MMTPDLPGERRAVVTDRAYELVCAGCGAVYADDGLRLACERPDDTALLRTRYRSDRFQHPAHPDGLYRFAGWLPVRSTFTDVRGCVAYRAGKLGRALGLDQLWVTFSGYWPERDVDMPTGTFKDLEAGTVLGRLPKDPPILVVASAGNTAAAFAAACTRFGQRCLIIVPAWALGRLALAGPLSARVSIVALDGDATYDDAIKMAEAVGRLPGFQLEGGVRNVGRRDGLGTCMLTAFEAIGRLPGAYFQGVGSGAGAVAAYEAAQRLRRHGYASGPPPRMMLCQNAPYAPMHAAWLRSNGEPDAVVAGADAAVVARELTNSNPPYLVRGGVYEALSGSGGTVLTATNAEVTAAMRLFERMEGIDVEPAAGVAIACLASAARSGRLARDEPVLLNVTGGGLRRRERDRDRVEPRPDLLIHVADTRGPECLRRAADRIAGLVAGRTARCVSP